LKIVKRARAGAPPQIHAPSVVMAGAIVGTDTVIGAFCFVASGAVIGAGTRIQSHVSVWDGVVLGEDVFVGPAAAFTNVRRPRAAFPRSPAHGGTWHATHVEDGASIGANATLIAPVRVGRCAMVGAATVVTRDVPAHAIVVGSPARVVGWACACGETLTRDAMLPVRAVCTECGRAFESRADALHEVA
jgi:UDP-2-acetamido-3-amino-2,3-dideoxy-glucuronate N-acetyltransferase